eukprot:1140754-Rhodomonas_salina.1
MWEWDYAEDPARIAAAGTACCVGGWPPKLGAYNPTARYPPPDGEAPNGEEHRFPHGSHVSPDAGIARTSRTSGRTCAPTSLCRPRTPAAAGASALSAATSATATPKSA